MTTKKTLKKLVKEYYNILKNLGFKMNDNFKKDFLHIERMKGNETKISYIKKSKIEGLEKNVSNFKLEPNDQEQREKYFTGEKPIKFLNRMITDESKMTKHLFNNIAQTFSNAFLSNIKSKFKIFSGAEIGEQYHKSKNVCGCMSGERIEYFDIYRDTKNLFMVALVDSGDTILTRSLLWKDEENNNFWMEKTYDDSIINGEEELRKEYQLRLMRETLIHISATEKDPFKFGCAEDYYNILTIDDKNKILEDFGVEVLKNVMRKKEHQSHTDLEGKTTQRETEESKNSVIVQPMIEDFDADSYDYFPYSDTFKSIGRTTGKYYIDTNEGSDTFVCLRSTEGEDVNNRGVHCECCDTRVDEEEIHYSDCEEEYLCDDCATYIEERGDVCRSENSTYNNYSGDYHYTRDLDY